VQPAAPKNKQVWPWIVGGAALVVLGGLVAAAFFVVGALGAADSGPNQAVLDLDKAYTNSDCELYFSATTDEFRQTNGPVVADCDAFDQVVADFNIGYSDYAVVIMSTDITGDLATVVTTESYLFEGERDSEALSYSLVKIDGTWQIDDITSDEEDGE
jgi:hypothetical protein